MSTPMDPVEKLMPNTVGRLAGLLLVIQEIHQRHAINNDLTSDKWMGVFGLGGGTIHGLLEKQTCITSSTRSLMFVALAACLVKKQNG
ncbi:hypothetical protein Tco_0645345 [Tanacetum coccineum]